MYTGGETCLFVVVRILKISDDRMNSRIDSHEFVRAMISCTRRAQMRPYLANFEVQRETFISFSHATSIVDTSKKSS
jgi:hypothetical protein